LLATDPVSQGTDAELLRRLQRGDNAAWTAVTRTYGPRLFAYLRQNLPSADDAEDALSETLTAAVRALVAFDGRATLSTFLYSIAYRKVADFWRRDPHTVSLETAPAAAMTAAHDPKTDERILLEDALNRLPEVSKQVLLLRYQIGLGVDEIAEILGRSYKGTESLLSRARAQLRDVIEGEPRP
jgi:RNA polymerase sigma-70 factor, ECF subfamily